MELFKERYPEISFLLSFFPHEKTEPLCDLVRFEAWLESLCLDEIEVLYCVGLIDFALPGTLLDWLKKKKERAFIFLEENLGNFKGFDQKALVEHPQIHFFYIEKDLEPIVEQFPTDKLAIYHESEFDATALKRKSATLSALYSDVLYGHKIMENVVEHYGRLENAFDGRGRFEKIPAIICGAGPSLDHSFDTLKKLSDKALIFAGGSTISAMSKRGLLPHIGMALDPNEEELDRLKQNTYFEGPFLFAPRLQKDVFSTLNGPFGFLKTDTGGLIENWLEEKMGFSWDPVGPDLGEEAFSVTTIAMAHALLMGCDPIIFVGVDLCFKDGRRYAKGVEGGEISKQDPRALEEVLRTKDYQGNEVETLLKWVMESDCISEFAKKHPETTFYNASVGGLGFKGIENCDLSDILETTSPQDISGRIHQWVETSPLNFDRARFSEVITTLADSLENCLDLVEKILNECKKRKESGPLVVYQMDLEDEEAYTLLGPVDAAVKHLSVRYVPHIDPSMVKWERTEIRYQELKRHIQLIKPIIEKQREKICQKSIS